MTEAEVKALGYGTCRQLPDGKWIALHQFIFTYGIVYDIKEFTYVRRWCYPKENFAEALKAYEEWDGTGKPPGPWVAEK